MYSNYEWNHVNKEIWAEMIWFVACLRPKMNKNLEEALSMKTFSEIRLCCVYITAQLQHVIFIEK